MKLSHTTFFALGVLLSIQGSAQQAVLPAAVQEETPAQGRIAEAKQQIATNPKRVQAYNELALASIRRARETADPKYLKDADAALAQGLELDPENFQLQKTHVVLLLSRHEFAQARDLATVLHRRTPDDGMVYGYIAEADIALGDYAEAENDAQWMMNMRPNNTPALLVGAKLRMLYGDAHGAIDFLSRAYSQTAPTDVEELAWIANQIASIQIESGQADVAAHSLEDAGNTFPRYPYTIENLARCSSTLDAGRTDRQGPARSLRASESSRDRRTGTSRPRNIRRIREAGECAGNVYRDRNARPDSDGCQQHR
jgi:tetratricopeptide (TPR) repeat protein